MNNHSKAPVKKLTDYEIYENVLKICLQKEVSSILSTHAFTDLDFVREDGNDIISIFTTFIGTQTKFGEVATFLTTLYPTTDIEVLKSRQNFIQTIQSNQALLHEIEKVITEIKKIEDELTASFFGDLMSDAEFKMIASALPFFNKIPALWSLSAATFFTVLALFSLPNLVALYGSYEIMKNPKAGAEIFNLLFQIDITQTPFYARAGLTSLILGLNIGGLSVNITLVMLILNIIKRSQQKLISFATALSAAEKLHTLLKKSNLLTEEFKKAIPALSALEEFINDPELKTIKNLLHKDTFKGEASVLSNWGNSAVAIQALTEEVRKKFVPLVSVFGSLDMYSAIAKLMQDQKKESKNQFCYAEYLENAYNPVLELKKVWNPLILTHKSIENIITNDVIFDNDMHLMMVTGPNTCGKTIITTSYVVAALFAQTLGIVPAASCLITPFDSLYVLLTIRSDGSVGDSRFNAEIREMKLLIEALEKLQKEGKFALILVDEPFTGTNAADGEKAAVRLIEKIYASKCLENIIMMIATHYHKLTSLAQQHKNIVNYQVSAQRNADGSLTRFFKLIPGISNLSVVQDLLEKAGF